MAPGIVLDPAEIIGEGEAFVACANGVPFFGYTLVAIGRELVITTAAGRSRCDLVKALATLAEVHGAGFDSIRFHTVRPGLVRKARQLGYAVAAVVDGTYIMRKQNVK